MPRKPQKVAATTITALTALELRALRELATRPALSRIRLEELVGSANVGRLPTLGMAAEEALDTDGHSERVWTITAVGKQAIKGAAVPMVANGRASPKIARLVPWFGSGGAVALAVGQACKGRTFVAIPFCGSLVEVPAISAAGATACLCNDMHAHLINLARVAADPVLGAQLYRRLRRMPFESQTLANAQTYCKREPISTNERGDVIAATQYFIAAWMGRSGNAGTDGELKGALAMRWSASGGDSALRFSGAVWSLRDWRKILTRCTLTCLDCFDFLAKVADTVKTVVYADPPWPGAGEAYLHWFTDEQHRALAITLGSYTKARVVLRIGGERMGFVESLYPKDVWDWRAILGRDQANAQKAEYLIVKENS